MLLKETKLIVSVEEGFNLINRIFCSVSIEDETHCACCWMASAEERGEEAGSTEHM